MEKGPWKAALKKYTNKPKAGIAGFCTGCDQDIPGKPGVKHQAVLKHHMFQLCDLYPWSKNKK